MDQGIKAYWTSCRVSDVEDPAEWSVPRDSGTSPEMD